MIVGKVVEKATPSKPVAGARLSLRRDKTKNDQPGDLSEDISKNIFEILSDSEGNFVFNSLPSGNFVLNITAIGYNPTSLIFSIDSASNESESVYLPTEMIRLNVELEKSVSSVQTVVIQSTQRLNYSTSTSPIKVDVITSQQLDRNRTANLMDIISSFPGLFQQIDCGICYTNSIRINGMDGPYTTVLIDGTPVIGALSSVYGLNGINPSLIEQIEVIKGPSSTLYGSGAMGGVVNIITKDPRFSPRWSVESSAASVGEQTLDIASSSTLGNWDNLLSASYYRMPKFIDNNNDNFSDITQGYRLAMFSKFARYTDKALHSAFTVKHYDEERYGGERAWTPNFKGSDSLYGEHIRTSRNEVIAVQSLDRMVAGSKVQLSLSSHRQNSYYGDVNYKAHQLIGNADVIVNRRIAGSHNLLLGATVRADTYRDKSPVNTGNYTRYTPGIFVEDDIEISDNLTLSLGSRIDRHTDHGMILSPRAGIKLSPHRLTSVRINAGTGFRVVNLFTEDHASLSGAREVVITENLKPERSASVALNVNQLIEFGINNMLIDIDAFYTRFSNKISPDYDTDPRQVIYGNLGGHAVSRGVGVALNQNFSNFPFLYSLAAAYQDVYSIDGSLKEKEFFSPVFKGNAAASYALDKYGVSLDYNSTIIGRMRMPEYSSAFSRPTQSPLHAVHDFQLTVRPPRLQGYTIYGSIKNLFGYTQGSPVVDASNPFSDDFDLGYVWGPLQGRKFVMGIRLDISR